MDKYIASQKRKDERKIKAIFNIDWSNVYEIVEKQKLARMNRKKKPKVVKETTQPVNTVASTVDTGNIVSRKKRATKEVDYMDWDFAEEK